MSEEEKGKWNLSEWFADADSSSKQEDKETADGIGKKVMENLRETKKRSSEKDGSPNAASQARYTHNRSRRLT